MQEKVGEKNKELMREGVRGSKRRGRTKNECVGAEEKEED